MSSNSINNPANSLTDVFGDGPSSSMRYLSPMGALALSAVYTCVKIIAEDCSTLDINIEKKVGRDWIIDPDHYLNGLFQDPHPQHTLNTILESWVGNTALTGNGILIPKRNDRTGRAYELDIRSFQEVNIYHPLKRSDTWYQVVDDAGMLSPVMSHFEVCHLKGMSFDGRLGLSPVGMARQSVLMGLSSMEYANENYINGGFGGGFVESDDEMDATSRLKFAKEIKRAQSLGIHPVLDRGMKITPNKISPKDIQFIETMKFSRSDIASIYRVPLTKFATDIKAAGSSQEQSSIAYVTDCIRPWVRRMENELERILIPSFEKATRRIKFDLTSLMRGDSTSEANYYSQMLTNRVMVPNEVRRIKGLPAVEWGDDPIDHQKAAPGGPNINTITKKEIHVEEE